MEKYIANNPAKNISSLESHTMVPTLTMLGRVSEWILLLSMAEAAVTRSLLPAIRGAGRRGRQPRRVGRNRRPPGRSSPSLKLVAHVDPAVTGISPSATLPLAADESALPPFSVPVVLTEARPQTWIAVVVLVAAALYLYGVYRLRLRGDRWPIARTAAFVGAGLGSIASVTVTGIGTYDTTLLSVHMVQHMVLSMIAPIFLALGAPVTLALRTLIGAPRRWLLALVHSRYARFVTHPLVAFGLFVINPFVLYFTDLYRLSLENEFFHEFVHAHFLITGCVFFWPLLGLDPLPRRWPYPARGLLMVLSVPFHTVLGLTI